MPGGAIRYASRFISYQMDASATTDSGDQDTSSTELYAVKFAYSDTADTGSRSFLSESEGQYAVCSVCQAPGTRSWSLMVPGTQSCPTSAWVADYTGYLMSHTYNKQGRSVFDSFCSFSCYILLLLLLFVILPGCCCCGFHSLLGADPNANVIVRLGCVNLDFKARRWTAEQVA